MTEPTKPVINMPTPSSPKQQKTKPSFNRFRDLPQEIRAQIWEYSLPKPRIVHMSSMRTRAGTHRLLTRPEMWRPRSKLQFCFYENGNDLYRGDQTAPKKSPLRFACRESHNIWQNRYSIPEIRLSHELRVNLNVAPKSLDICGKKDCVVLKARRPAPSHIIPHRHRYYKKADGRGFLINVRGLIDMKRDTLIMDPVVFSLINGDLGLELDISKLKSIAYTSSIEYRPAWKPPGHDGSYKVIEGAELFLYPAGDGYDLRDPDINENLIVEQDGEARDNLVQIGEEDHLPAEKTKNVASKDIWRIITQCCPRISSIQ
ncbi:hypothetical protein BOTCAL_0038g00380 [Botryotinia calthae]|uniref:2EXR domain-containing protein n=1 Tax=Botryotinia calthae TaxID=38488 RepID=A0A4Y8DCA9_9HELO|nr:hypothetical protein BOTCAL_0038g00380 [Botryotinia calthae]